jgi:16S rRNA (uracil1498-N3)-methyltransferase
LQKWVEVWVTGFYFYRSEKSQKLNLSENKILRLNKIIIEAVEQSWRSRVPEFIIEDNISLEYFKENENIFFHTEDNNSVLLKNLKLNYSKWINLFVWPEWGFTEKEIKIFEKNNFKKIHLWNRILRTETVWVVAWFYIVQNKT